MSAAFHPQFGQIATVAYDGQVLLWDVASGNVVRSLDGHRDRVYFVAYSPDGSRLATSAGDGTVRTWDALSGEPLHVIHGPQDVSAVAWHPREDEIATSSADGKVLLYNLSATHRPLVVWTRDPLPPAERMAEVATS